MDQKKTQLVFASNNKHKFNEIAGMLDDRFSLLSLADIGCFTEIPETQNTIEGNAIQKAQFILDNYNTPCFADDTGLEIEALHGEPGVFSSRYAGEKCDFEDNMNLVLAKLGQETYRNARFRTVIALAEKSGTITFEGIVEGTIMFFRKGTGGFGYDPIFKPDGLDKTFAEMTMEEKNAISHRAIALKAFTDYLKSR
ncbi:MAG TPA: RdgB/HAM1 family non-canonical purine NTP pyrophosphatase [Bacteroidales bacterium]|nr:RdgB/HAM1 family non-canonical purine NTP pyrophosphatase [Bacteroidales bacterium]